MLATVVALGVLSASCQPRSVSGSFSQVSHIRRSFLKVLWLRWEESGKQLPSLRTIYRFLRTPGYDTTSLCRGRLKNGPTKAFDAPFVNDLRMADFSPGLKLQVQGNVIVSGRIVLRF